MASKLTALLNQIEFSAKSTLESNLDVIDQADVPGPRSIETNQGFLLNTGVLFADIRGSSQMNLRHNRTTLAKLYRIFLRDLARAADAFGGRTTSFAGDRIMVVFPSQAAALRASLTAAFFQLVLSKVNDHIRRRGYSALRCGIGIDYGLILVTKVDARDLTDLHWAGPVISRASKLADAAPVDGVLATTALVQALPRACRPLLFPGFPMRNFLDLETHPLDPRNYSLDRIQAVLQRGEDK